MTSNDFEVQRAQREAQYEKDLGIVRDALAKIDRDGLLRELEQEGTRDIFIDAVEALFDDPRFISRLAANLHHDDYSFTYIVFDTIAETIAGMTPRTWVEPMYISGTRPSLKLCEKLRDLIVPTFGRKIEL